MPEIKPVLLGCAGPQLTHEERGFFAETNPFGFIVFQRNCQTPEQLRALTGSLRDSVGRANAPIFIDQEGGRVARLKPPHWPAFPALRRIGVLYEQDPALGRMAMYLHCLLTARMLRDVGIDGNCAPVLDLFLPDTAEAIGDRAISAAPDVVAACARVAIDTFLQQGILPVIKHMPGHGRVKVDPHVELPFVDATLDVLRERDFVPFEKLNDAPIAMNCHVVFRALDPDVPVSLSHKAHRDFLRGEIGFEGLIFSDDLAMGAISCPLEERAARALQAGADIALYCTGRLDEMDVFCRNLPPMSEVALVRWKRAQTMRRDAVDSPVSVARLRGQLDQLIEMDI